ncbi:hypothetical protein Lser_V15G28386 [Lactuca serriola]
MLPLTHFKYNQIRFIVSLISISFSIFLKFYFNSFSNDNTTQALLIEGIQIFSQSHEHQWQHQATWSLTDAGINSFRAVKSRAHIIIRACKAVLSYNGGSREVRETASHMRKVKSSYLEKKKTLNRTWTSLDAPILPYGQWVFSIKKYQ